MVNSFPEQAGAYPLNPIQQYYQIIEASEKADYVIVIVHGGTELYNLPTPRMKATYRFFIDCGADCVINHHQHCFSGYELYKEHPIFYGLGNLCFDKNTNMKIWHEGYMVQLVLENSAISFDIIPYIQCNSDKTITINIDKDPFLKTIERLNNTIVNDNLLEKLFNTLAISRTLIIRSLFEPYSSRLLSYFIRKIGGPFFKAKKGYRQILANLQCESHNDIVMKVLENLI